VAISPQVYLAKFDDIKKYESIKSKATQSSSSYGRQNCGDFKPFLKNKTK
jgi:hypothetical protein